MQITPVQRAQLTTLVQSLDATRQHTSKPLAMMNTPFWDADAQMLRSPRESIRGLLYTAYEAGTRLRQGLEDPAAVTLVREALVQAQVAASLTGRTYFGGYEHRRVPEHIEHARSAAAALAKLVA